MRRSLTTHSAPTHTTPLKAVTTKTGLAATVGPEKTVPHATFSPYILLGAAALGAATLAACSTDESSTLDLRPEKQSLDTAPIHPTNEPAKMGPYSKPTPTIAELASTSVNAGLLFTPYRHRIVSAASAKEPILTMPPEIAATGAVAGAETLLTPIRAAILRTQVAPDGQKITWNYAFKGTLRADVFLTELVYKGVSRGSKWTLIKPLETALKEKFQLEGLQSALVMGPILGGTEAIATQIFEYIKTRVHNGENAKDVLKDIRKNPKIAAKGLVPTVLRNAPGTIGFLAGREMGYEWIGKNKNEKTTTSEKGIIAFCAAFMSIVPTLPLDNIKGLIQTNTVKNSYELFELLQNDPGRLFRGMAKVPFSIFKQAMAYAIFEYVMDIMSNDTSEEDSPY